MAAAEPYRTAPEPLTTMPPGIPFIIGNEAAERFSFYGMKAILTVYMTKYLVGWDGAKATLSDEDAKSAVHLFVASAYFFPILGAIAADWLLGKYRTSIWLSLVYVLGHVLLSAVPGQEGLLIGLALIAVGAGGIKPCVSAHVGDQFSELNQHLLTRVFGWFYFSVNFGATFSTMLTPWLLSKFGHQVAFGVPAVLMFLATIVFWLGRYRYAHIPPGGNAYLRETFSAEGLSAIYRLVPLYLFVSIFWALYDQTASAWVLQAEQMNRQWLGYTWESSQIQAINPILVLVLIPVFSYGIYPALGRVVRLTPLVKINIGLFLTALTFAISASIEEWIGQGQSPSIVWQFLAYFVLTCAEVMVSITCLEFSYTQAPNRMKSFIMALYLLSVSLGNLLTSVINQLIKKPDGTTWLPGASYYWFFAGMMFVAALGFILVALTFREKTYIQEAQPETEPGH